MADSNISFKTLMNKINPLNLKENYNDCVIAFKILLNLSDNDTVRNLGQQIIDSYLLLNLLNGNSKLKKYFPEYNVLCDKLYMFVNKYSQFEKLLRNNEVKTKANLVSENEELGNNLINSKKVNIIIESNDNSLNYSLNEIIKSTGLFRIILCKDKDERFKKIISKKIMDSNTINNDNAMSDDAKKILKRKKDNLINTIISDDEISDNQTSLFNLIEEKYKELVYLEQKSNILENFMDESMSHLFVLDSQIAKIYADFKELCKNEIDTCIKNKQSIIVLINSYLDEYEIKYKDNQVNDNNNSNLVYSDINYNKIYNEYISNEKMEYSDFDISNFIKYIKYVFKNKNIDLIDEQNIVDEFEKIYSKYLIDKLGGDNSYKNFGDYLNNYFPKREYRK